MNSLIQLKLLFIMSIILLVSYKLMAQEGLEPAKIERVGQSGWQFLKI